MYLTLAAHRKVPPRSAKWIRESGSGLPDTARKISPSLPLFTFFFLFSFLAACELAGKQKQTGGAALLRRPVALARLHKYYANIRSGPVTSRNAPRRAPCGRARPLRSSFSAPRRFAALAKCRCLFPPRYARLACLPYRPEIAGTLHTQHNSTPNLLPQHSPALPLFLVLSFSPYRTPIAPLSLLHPALSLLIATALLLELALSSRRLPPATSSRLRYDLTYVDGSALVFDLRLNARSRSSGTRKRAEVALLPGKTSFTLTNMRGSCAFVCVPVRCD